MRVHLSVEPLIVERVNGMGFDGELIEIHRSESFDDDDDDDVQEIDDHEAKERVLIDCGEDFCFLHEDEMVQID